LVIHEQLNQTVRRPILHLICFGIIAAVLGDAISTSAAIANVSVINFAYVPDTTNIFVNDTVIWTWPAGSTSHNVVSTSDPQVWDDSAIADGPFTFTNVFTAAGSFPYICTVHGFTGTINVSNAVPAPAVAITSPANGATLSAPASFTLAATASDSGVNITNVQFLEGTNLLGNFANAPFSIAVTDLGPGDYTFAAVASDDAGLSATNSIVVHVVPGNIILLNGHLVFGGVAIGTMATNVLTISNGGGTVMTVSNIVYPAGFSGAFSGAIGPGSNQTVAVIFSPTTAATYNGTITVNSDAPNGINTIPVSGFGVNGNLVLTIATTGTGAVQPNLNNRLLKSGVKYTIRAIAGTGEVFSNWSGSLNTNSNPLTFTMKPGTLLQANFIPNPFLPWQGSYNGLFSVTNHATANTAGMLRHLTVRPTGAYSGVLLVSGGSYLVAGGFNLSGQATNQIIRADNQGGPMTVNLSMNSNAPLPQITGTVSGSNWTANLLADRAASALSSTEYTMLIPPDLNNSPPDSSPGGAGYALISDDAKSARITGALADGTAFHQSVPVSQDGYIPIYDSLYNGHGFLLGWINLIPTNASGIGLTWIRPPHPTGLFKSGFTNAIPASQLFFSPWTNPPADLGLLTNLIMVDTFDEANEGNAVTNVAAISRTGKVTGTSVHGSINLKNGLLKVTIGNGPSKVVASGAILLNATNGGGFFLTKTNAQAIILSP
jgi:plastocyanin